MALDIGDQPRGQPGNPGQWRERPSSLRPSGASLRRQATPTCVADLCNKPDGIDVTLANNASRFSHIPAVQRTPVLRYQDREVEFPVHRGTDPKEVLTALVREAKVGDLEFPAFCDDQFYDQGSSIARQTWELFHATARAMHDLLDKDFDGIVALESDPPF